MVKRSRIWTKASRKMSLVRDYSKMLPQDYTQYYSQDRFVQLIGSYEKDRINQLLGLKYSNEVPFFHDANGFDFYQWSGLLRIFEFEKLYQESVIKAKQTDNFQDFFRSLSIYDSSRDKIQREIDDLRNDMGVVDGGYICAVCSSSKTVAMTVQRRSSDEPATLYIRCVACKHSWKMEA